MEFLLETEKARVQSIIASAQLAQQQTHRFESDEELFFPIIPPRCIKLEVVALDNTMWRISCINHPPPLTIPIWF